MDAIGPRWKRKTRKALRHAGFRIALVLVAQLLKKERKNEAIAVDAAAIFE